jgi:NTP pyrophosphatase (non-canonical NTP hydrolase)
MARHLENGVVFKIEPLGGVELVRFCENGDIFIRGEKVDSNQDAWKLLKDLLQARLTIRELMDASWEHAEAKGFHAEHKSFAEDCALFHSEISEALEEYRNGHETNEVYLRKPDTSTVPKPEGVPSELADVFIRIADVCKTHNIDLEGAIRQKLVYNQTRAFRHGGKKL